MFIGPVFSREVVTAPRRTRLYAARAIYAVGLLVLAGTAWTLVTGTQVIRNIGDVARFGAMLFDFLAPLQMVLAVAFSALMAASAVAQEKDRRTLILLLMTRLTNVELVAGKLLASMLLVLVMLAASLPVYMLCALLGGVSFAQIGRVFAVTLAAALAAGSLGSTLAYWREKTFQTLALMVLLAVVWMAGWELVYQGILGPQVAGVDCAALARWFSPWRAIDVAAAAYVPVHVIHPTTGYLLQAALVIFGLNLIATLRVRRWQLEAIRRDPVPDEKSSIWGDAVSHAQAEHLAVDAEQIREQLTAEQRHRLAALVALREHPTPETSAEPAPDDARFRRVWDNPILWREVRTWAYGRKVLVVRFVYLLLAAAAAAALIQYGRVGGLGPAQLAAACVPLFLLSLVLVNAQAVTAFCSERDGRALDLLLVTDLTPREIVFGKLGGVFYNAKEMWLVPVALSLYLLTLRDSSGLPLIGGEEVFYLAGGLLVMFAFVATLGIHAGMTYISSRSAIGVSLGTVFFLFLGIATCMRMMVAFAGSFEVQLLPFFAFLVGGGIGLYVALGYRNPSNAIGWASATCPFFTFWAIISVLQGQTLGVFLVTTATYGFATAAMLVPAVHNFDVALGRTTGDEAQDR